MHVDLVRKELDERLYGGGARVYGRSGFPAAHRKGARVTSDSPAADRPTPVRSVQEPPETGPSASGPTTSNGPGTGPNHLARPDRSLDEPPPDRWSVRRTAAGSPRPATWPRPESPDGAEFPTPPPPKWPRPHGSRAISCLRGVPCEAVPRCRESRLSGFRGGRRGVGQGEKVQSVQAPPASDEALAAAVNAMPRAPSSTVGKSRARGSARVPVRRAATASATSE